MAQRRRPRRHASRISTSAGRRWSARRPRTTTLSPIVTDPADYAEVLAELRRTAAPPPWRCAAGWRPRPCRTPPPMTRRSPAGSPSATRARPFRRGAWPFAGRRASQTLRYGENPHQTAAVLRSPAASAPASPRPRQLQGKELSYNNFNDADAALRTGRRVRPAGPAVRHRQARQPLRRGHRRDAARGLRAGARLRSGLGLRRHRRRQPPLDGATAEAIAEIFTEVVIAPEADAEALASSPRRRTCACCMTGALPDPARAGHGAARPSPAACWSRRATTARSRRPTCKVVTKRAPTAQELHGLLFAWTVAKHVKSNAIVYAKDGATAGRRRRPDEPPNSRASPR